MQEIKRFSDAGIEALSRILDELDRDTLFGLNSAIERGGATLRLALDITPDGGSSVRLEVVSDGRSFLVASLAGRTPFNVTQRHPT